MQPHRRWWIWRATAAPRTRAHVVRTVIWYQTKRTEPELRRHWMLIGHGGNLEQVWDEINFILLRPILAGCARARACVYLSSAAAAAGDRPCLVKQVFVSVCARTHTADGVLVRARACVFVCVCVRVRERSAAADDNSTSSTTFYVNNGSSFIIIIIIFYRHARSSIAAVSAPPVTVRG